MISIKNESKPEMIEVLLHRFKLLTCWRCLQPMKDGDGTVMMHVGCWEKSSYEEHDQAERDLMYALQHKMSIVQKGIAVS